jgi:hypothetical protein
MVYSTSADRSGRTVKGMNCFLSLSNAGIVGSNPIQGMDVCVPLFCEADHSPPTSA